MRRLLAAAVAAAAALGAAAAWAQAPRAATFAGGCFWCIESDFDHVAGVLETVSGYTGGDVENPTYEEVSRGGTGHREALRIVYDPETVTYSQLLEVFWHSVDPTDAGGQFCDRGEPYETAVFVHDEEQRRLAEASKAAAAKALGAEVATPIEAARAFYPAEDHHQDYARKNPLRYKFYRWNCGRDRRVRDLWGEKAYAGIPEKQ